eukprot:gene6740-4859_t
MFGFSIVPAPQSSQEEDPDKHKYGFFMVLIIAIAIPVAGVLGGWNMGAASGLWSLFFGTFFVGATLSGSYALTFGFETSYDFEPVYYVIIYLVTFLIQLRGGNLLWNSVIACSIITIFPVVLFLCGAFSKYDYNKYAELQPSMYKGFAGSEEFMTQSLFSPTYFYIGIEMLPQVCNHVRNPNVTLPRGLFYGCILSVLISLLAVIACAGIAPGYGEDFAAVGYPMDQILYEVYGIPARISDIIFVLSSNLLCVFSLMYSSGHQMGALAKSGLLPPFMGLTYGPHNRKKATKSAFSISTIVGDTMVVMFGRSNLFRGGSTHNSASRDTNGATIASRGESVSRSKRVIPAAAAAAGDSRSGTITDSFVATGETKSDRGNASKITPLPARTSMPVIVETEPHEILVPVPVEPIGVSVKSPSIKSPSAKASSVKMGSKKSQLRASWNVNNQGIFGMSNKAMTTQESQKFMEIVLGHGDESPEEMLATLANNFPEQFVMQSHGTA